jgi:hypothetical protein
MGDTIPGGDLNAFVEAGQAAVLAARALWGWTANIMTQLPAD